MKKVFIIFALVIFMTIPAISFAGVPGADIDAALGGWMQKPSGDLSYGEDLSSEDILDVEDDLDYDSITSITARAKLKLPVLPGLYLVVAPMKFDSDALVDNQFKFGDFEFDPDEPISSEVTLNQYDICLFYPIPMLKLASMGKLNIELGLNARVMDLKAEVEGTTVDIIPTTEKESNDVMTVVPLIYLGAKLEPIERFAVEGEFRGVTYSDNTLISIITRLRIKILGPAYGAVGYRYDTIKVESDDLEIETAFSGPFLEAGFSL